MRGFSEIAQTITHTIEAHTDLPVRTSKVLVAVSGGPDSVLLLHAVHRLGYEVGIAHCNYQLRGEDSEAEEALVRRYAEELGVRLHAVRFDTKSAVAESKGESLQLVARNLRYAFFEQLLDTQGYTVCALAHHADDQTETLLMSLIRGGYGMLMKEMPIRRGRYIRPMMGLTKEEILGALQAEGIAYRMDKSNEKNDYLRNQFRNQVIPLLNAINPSLTSQLLNKNHYYKLQYGFVRKQLRQVLPECERISETGRQLVWQAFIERFGEEYLELLLQYVLERWEIHGGLAREVIRLKDSPTGRWVAIDKGRIYRTREGILWQYIVDESDEPIQLDAVEGSLSVQLGNQSLEFECPYEGQLEFGDSSRFYMDAAKVLFPLTLRRWRLGDRIRPFGQKSGSQKLSDIFINQKLNAVEKKQVIVVEDREGKIICVTGFRIAHSVRLRKSTQTVLLIAYKP